MSAPEAALAAAATLLACSGAALACKQPLLATIASQTPIQTRKTAAGEVNKRISTRKTARGGQVSKTKILLENIAALRTAALRHDTTYRTFGCGRHSLILAFGAV